MTKFFSRKPVVYKPHKIPTRAKIRLHYYRMLLETSNFLDRFRISKGSTESFGDGDGMYEDIPDDFISSNSSSRTRQEVVQKKAKNSQESPKSSTTKMQKVAKPLSPVRRESGDTITSSILDSEKSSYEEIGTTGSKRRIHPRIKRRLHSFSHLSDQDSDRTLHAETQTVEILHTEKAFGIGSKSSQTEGESTLLDAHTSCSDIGNEAESESEKSEESEEDTSSLQEELFVSPPVRDDKMRAEVVQMWLHKKRTERTHQTIAESFSHIKNTIYALTHRRRDRVNRRPAYNVNFGVKVVDPRKPVPRKKKKVVNGETPKVSDRRGKLKRKITEGTTAWWAGVFGRLNASDRPTPTVSRPTPDPNIVPNPVLLLENIEQEDPAFEDDNFGTESNADYDYQYQNGSRIFENNEDSNGSMGFDYRSRPHPYPSYPQPYSSPYTRMSAYYRDKLAYWRNYPSSHRFISDLSAPDRNTGYNSANDDESGFYYKPQSPETERYAALLRK